MNNCEQKNCSKLGHKWDFDEQFYCVLCDMELCSICIFEHREAYSISGLKCDNQICRGSRIENDL
jgi:HD-like signal output (HDOD) protein